MDAPGIQVGTLVGRSFLQLVPFHAQVSDSTVVGFQRAEYPPKSISSLVFGS
jgi:hypothetical protein